ncbi:MAG: helix-turn-helix transcriptional regulator [Saccharofermentanales bacterium]|mgnify:CR=1 FL=1|jgi:putative transcriptional regulator|nr:helix-turn-helix transcriptional regulator [Clostridiaceae bacterium]
MRVWLIERRKKQQMTQLAVARKIGITRAYYAQLELASRSPSIKVAKKLADVLDFEWTVFYNDDPEN